MHRSSFNEIAHINFKLPGKSACPHGWVSPPDCVRERGMSIRERVRVRASKCLIIPRGLIWGWRKGGVRQHALCGLTEADNSSKHATYGDMWEGWVVAVSVSSAGSDTSGLILNTGKSTELLASRIEHCFPFIPRMPSARSMTNFYFLGRRYRRYGRWYQISTNCYISPSCRTN